MAYQVPCPVNLLDLLSDLVHDDPGVKQEKYYNLGSELMWNLMVYLRWRFYLNF
jgi:hypothetical protein